MVAVIKVGIIVVDLVPSIQMSTVKNKMNP